MKGALALMPFLQFEAREEVITLAGQPTQLGAIVIDLTLIEGLLDRLVTDPRMPDDDRRSLREIKHAVRQDRVTAEGCEIVLRLCVRGIRYGTLVPSDHEARHIRQFQMLYGGKAATPKTPPGQRKTTNLRLVVDNPEPPEAA